MPGKLKWLDQANNDLQSIFDFISSDSPRAAISYFEALTQACERLTFFPESGRVYNTRYRVLVVRNHLIFYRYDPTADEIAIVTIIDGRRDVATIIEDI